MSSVAQIALGILILGAAFVFGSHIRSLNQDKSVASENARETSSDSDLVWQRPEQIARLQQRGNDSGALIDLPVAKRRVAAANDEATTQAFSIEPGPENSRLTPSKFCRRSPLHQHPPLTKSASRTQSKTWKSNLIFLNWK